MKKILFLVIIIMLSFSILGCERVKKEETGKIKVVTTLFPLYDFSRNIGQDKVEVTLLLPPGVEPHTFEPKPSDVLRINEADLFVYTGKFMEPWAEDIINGISGKDVKIIDASARINLLAQERADLNEKNKGIDPHFWLDFDNTKIMVDNITKTLVSKNSANAAYYQNNAQNYNEKLTKLGINYQSILTNCQSNEIVYGGHFAFGYLAHRYNLKYVAAQGFSPDSEPTVNDLIKLIEEIKGNNIKYIFYEELSSPKIAETLAKETGTELLLLNAAHNLTKEDFINNVSFVAIMESNLKNLSQGLNCEENFLK